MLICMYRPTSPRTPNGSSIGSAFFARLALVTIIHTGTHRPCYVCSNRPHLVLCIPTQSKMKNRFKCICCRNYSIGKLVSYYQLSHNSLLEVSRYFTVFLFETNLLKFLVFVLPFHLRAYRFQKAEYTAEQFVLPKHCFQLCVTLKLQSKNFFHWNLFGNFLYKTAINSRGGGSVSAVR